MNIPMERNTSLLIIALFFICNMTGNSQNKVRILVQGDTQKIVDQNPSAYLTTMEKVKTDPVTKEADFILQMGDITEDSKLNNWDIAQQGWNKLDGLIPYVLNVGNNDIMNGGEQNFNIYFPIDKYKKWPSFVSNYDGHSNVAHQFNAGGVDWLIISMRFERSEAVKTWAENLIINNLDKKVILISHDANLDGSEVEMCKKYENVLFVMCGHTASKHALLRGDNGNVMGWIKTCMHHKDKDDYFCVIDIDVANGVAEMRYYSPLKERYGDDVYAPWSWSGFEFKINGQHKANDSRFIYPLEKGTVEPDQK